MFKYIYAFALFVAMAFAAPQYLLRSAVIDNEGAKQVGLPFANGWTDGPNNGIGPVVAVAHAAPVVHAPLLHHGVAPVAYAAAAHQYII